MKFGMTTHFEPLNPSDPSNFENIKIQDGGGRHFEKLKKIIIYQQQFDPTPRNFSW